LAHSYAVGISTIRRANEDGMTEWTLRTTVKGWLVTGIAGSWIVESMHPALQRFLDEIKTALA
jgi:hypothetical protein